jgi:predicted TIM-barrel fold metal-dependent hydrolase
MIAVIGNPFRQRLLDEMAALPTVDSHSHTYLRREYVRQPERNLFTLLGYFGRDVDGLIGRSPVKKGRGAPAAPTTPATSEPSLYAGATSDAERWARLRGVLDRARNVSYWRHQIVTYQGLFDLADDDVTDDNWAALNERIKAYTARPDWFDSIHRKRCNLITQVRIVPWYGEWEPEYFTAVLQMGLALRLCEAPVRDGLAAATGSDLGDLASAKRAVADYLAGYVRRGAIGIKLSHAYWRSLAHEQVPEARAAAIYARAVAGEALPLADVVAFEDHIVWYLADLVAEMGLIFQIHTGMQGNWDHIPDSDPLGLLELIRAHRNVKFDLFHAGYPYARELGVVGKHYPNVWLNACWIYLITMAGSRLLSEWIDLVPAERLLGFGSDVFLPEFVYGHLVMARSCLADVLAEKVERDFLSKSAALDLARWMLRDSPMALYRLKPGAAATQAAG